ncbi:MAG: CoA-binding protein [Desulfobacula sp.]|uniref:CoA-binding protein n=1 Tax=Desulfobacula sp. TaxID=2593537 RepID=UPI001D97C7BC|nr:CoA-binding protein [Desulfobacula sp.]MBT3484722.1 CoA-binding protein [Desulfobacula sp.]MBT3804352.1 CoA-binding protein [Desulfobacula sp.]MBT4025143.1 CoA-binding protein [Desulfobacula sp.]MBT4198545.1 CoA-binding protein [Desulfobacula sp.]
MNLKHLFKPSTMAVVGVSTSQDNHPANVIYNKNHLRYPVKTFPVNPKGGILNRETLYPSVNHINENIDMAVIAVRAEYVIKVVEQCIKKGVKSAVIISGGFAEVGNLKLQNFLVDMAKEASFPFIGPNCLGIYAPDHVDTFFLPGERIIRPDKGNIGFVSQSGGVLVDQMVKFAGQGIGVSLGVSIGNKACIRETDMLDWFDKDPGTKAIAFYIEGFEKNEGRMFIKRAEKCSKPVVVLKAGKSKKGIEAVSSHTASLAGDYRVFSQIMKQYCVAEAENEHELTSFCEALSCYPKGIRGNVGIISLSGGHGVLAADACELYGIKIPVLERKTMDAIREKLSREIRDIVSLVNPMDLTGSSIDSDIVTSARHLSRDMNIDCILALLIPYSPGVSADIGAKLSQVARNEGKPMIAYVPNEDKYKIIIEGFELNNIPVASSVEGAVLMAKALTRCRPC